MRTIVQTSQIPTFVSGWRSAAVDDLLLQLHEADTVDKLSKALFALIESSMPYQFINLLFRPLEFEIPCRFTPTKYKPVVDAYMARHHKNDLWLKRSPVHPGVTVVRHGDHTPVEFLRASAYYRKTLKPLNSEYAVSVVVWRGSTWLATLTVMHNRAQGEFTDAEMNILHAIHPHFACVIRRLAGHQETRLIHSSVRRFVSGLPTATILLDWNLRPLHFSAVAAQLCFQWKLGARASLFKAPRNIQIPGDILAAIENMRPSLSKELWSRGQPRPSFRFLHPHPKIPWLSASIEFLPSRSLALSKGTFLVTLNEETGPQKDRTLAQKLRRLTKRERECALLAAEGLRNAEIAVQLGKSEITVRNQLTSIFRKLGLESRHKLIMEFARLDRSARKTLRSKR